MQNVCVNVLNFFSIQLFFLFFFKNHKIESTGFSFCRLEGIKSNNLVYEKEIQSFFCDSPLFYCWSCNDSDPHGSSYDPSLPVVINNFLPDSGGIRTKFIVEGSNFGTEPGKVKVYFNNKEALILGVKNDMVYAQVPKQPGDSCIVSVVVGQDSCIFQEKKFVYRIQASVSTVLGKLNESGSGGFVDGSLAEARFIIRAMSLSITITICLSVRQRLTGSGWQP